MRFEDAFGLEMSTDSPVAHEAYVDAVERFLCALPGMEAAAQRAIDADPQCALARAVLARAHQLHGRGAEARAAMAGAVLAVAGQSERERSHVHTLERVVMGDGAGAMAAARSHLQTWPRDFMVMAPCAGVFGLIGFSGLAGREQALYDFMAQFDSPCAGDWWFQAARAFSQCEVGQLDAARVNAERSLAQRPRNAHGAHIRIHVDYECGDDAAGLAWLSRWLDDYPQAGAMHGHLSWHKALSALELGDSDAARRVFDTQVKPYAAWGPPLNVLTDASSLLLRAELLGAQRPLDEWQILAGYAREQFPNPGLAFVDAHAALAYAMVGDSEALARLIAGARGPAADVVITLARGFEAFAQGHDAQALEHLWPLMATHERLGGSRAQRDLIEQTVLVAQRRSGRTGPWTRHRVRPLPVGLR
jgi:hypothetical protein